MTVREGTRRLPLAGVALALALTAGSSMVPIRTAAQVGSPAGAVPVERLSARRSALLRRVGTGAIVLRSAVQKDIEGDYPQDSDYREDNAFFYLTGLEAPGAWLVLLARDSAPETILYLPARDSLAERWTGPRLGPGPEATRLTGIADVRPSSGAETEIPGLVLGVTSPARRPGGALYIRRGQRQGDSEFLRRLVFSDSLGPAVRVANLDAEIAALRLIKDQDELARLRRSIGITTEAQRTVMAAAKPGMWEYEIKALVEFTFRRHGAERLGFPSIVGSGPNAVTLHYDKSRRQTRPGDVVVVDIGAEYGYYSADVTRTIPISGRFTPRQRAVYDLVLATQQAAIDSVRPGIDLRSLNTIARRYMREHSGDLCGPPSCEKYFVHGLSHWLGMDVHDAGAFTAKLAPGMVLTVEPGIYLPAENIGVRIEDDVLVTATGHEILSAGAPRAADDVERAMRQHGPRTAASQTGETR